MAMTIAPTAIFIKSPRFFPSEKAAASDQTYHCVFIPVICPKIKRGGSQSVTAKLSYADLFALVVQRPTGVRSLRPSVFVREKLLTAIWSVPKFSPNSDRVVRVTRAVLAITGAYY